MIYIIETAAAQLYADAVKKNSKTVSLSNQWNAYDSWMPTNLWQFRPLGTRALCTFEPYDLNPRDTSWSAFNYYMWHWCLTTESGATAVLQNAVRCVCCILTSIGTSPLGYCCYVCILHSLSYPRAVLCTCMTYNYTNWNPTCIRCKLAECW